jgi:biopolymer transport protein ExbD
MKSKWKEEEEVVNFQIAPMTDVVFQLLIFFLVTSTFAQLEVSKEVSLPVADTAVTKQNEGVTEILLNVLDDGRVKVGEDFYPVDRLAAELRRVAAENPDTDKKVLIRADKQAHYGKVMRIMAACAQADLWNVSFATYQEEPNKPPAP